MLSNFCCKKMNIALHTRNSTINYDPLYREYYVYIRYDPAVQLIDFCPWCGKKLPVRLSKIFFELTKKYNVKSADDLNNTKTMAKVPDEFKTDAWWKKRGL